MPQTIDRGGAHKRATDPHARRRHGGPILLATFASAPFDAQAARLAVEAAADLCTPLIVVDAVAIKAGRRGARSATDLGPPALVLALRAVAEHAHALGVPTETLRVSSKRPAGALLGFIAERRPALVVFGSDPAALRRLFSPSRRQYRRFAAALAEQTTCLLWTAQDPSAGPVSAAAPPTPAPQRARARR